jgi:hypothetical protein
MRELISHAGLQFYILQLDGRLTYEFTLGVAMSALQDIFSLDRIDVAQVVPSILIMYFSRVSIARLYVARLVYLLVL